MSAPAPAESAVERLRRLLAGWSGLREQKMFGGVCFMRHEHMLCGGGRDGILLRVGPELKPDLLAVPGTRVMSHGGRSMHGFVMVDLAALDDAALDHWLGRADRYLAGLPPRPAKPPRPRVRRP